MQFAMLENENTVQSGCRVAGCHFKTEHLTRAHRCGTCSKFGHGQRECGNKQAMEFENALYDKFPEEKKCKHPKCQSEHDHASGSHHEEFERMPSYVAAILERFKDVEKKAHVKLAGMRGYYVRGWVGMGNWNYFKNDNGTILKQSIDCMDKKRHDMFTSGFLELKGVEI
jgi:hypothetical protein